MSNAQIPPQRLVAFVEGIAQAQISNAVARMQAADHMGTLAGHVQDVFLAWYIPGYTGIELAQRIADELGHLGFAVAIPDTITANKVTR